MSESLDLEGRKKRIAEIDEIISSPDFWNDPEAGQVIMQEKKRLESKVVHHAALAEKLDDLDVMFELAKEENDPDMEQDIIDTLAEINKELDSGCRCVLTYLLCSLNVVVSAAIAIVI